MISNEYILSVRDFSAGFEKDGKILKAVDGISFDISKGKTLGIVGESGCGKSVTALSIMRLLPKPSGRYLSGTIVYNGVDLLSLPKEEMYKIRGNKISMIFQEPMTALNPVKKIGDQIAEVFQLHRPDMSKSEVLSEIINLLTKVGISDPLERFNQYPHQLSGGMRQRVMIAMALACKPDILIADEPTTALDVTIQAQILDLIKKLQEECGMSVIFITHDLGVISEISDDVVVMYAGKIVEYGSTEEIFKSPSHPYTVGLMKSIPSFNQKRKTRLQSIEGIVPSIGHYPEGCRFNNRCEYKFEPCLVTFPQRKELNENHSVFCHRCL